jgi:hypothetical protein
MKHKAKKKAKAAKASTRAPTRSSTRSKAPSKRKASKDVIEVGEQETKELFGLKEEPPTSEPNVHDPNCLAVGHHISNCNCMGSARAPMR